LTTGATPIVKLRIERADVAQLVGLDPLLKGAPLLKALGPGADAVLKRGVGLRYPHGVVLFQQGEPGHSLYFVLKGEVRLYARAGTEAMELGHAPRAEVVGEAEVLAGPGPRQVTAVAQGSLDVVEVPRDALLAPGGLLPAALREYLSQVQLKRQSKLKEMTDFLERW
jgi:CRP-like cAMP-binding protein